MSNLELYRWQRECLDAWEKHAFHGIVHVITGAGKTMCAMTGIRVLEDRLKTGHPETALRVRIVTPTIAIARQWVQSLRRFYEKEIRADERTIGLYYGAEKDDPDCFCMVYVVNSARHALSAHVNMDMQNGRHTFLIADECHHYTGDENKKIFDFQYSRFFDPSRYASMGLSATPQCARYDQVLVPALGSEIYWYGLREAVFEGQVSPFLIYQIAVSFTGEEVLQYSELSDTLAYLHGQLLNAFPALASSGGGSFFMRILELAKKLDDPQSLPQKYLNVIYLRRSLVTNARNRMLCAASLIRRLPRTERIILFCEKISQTDRIAAYMQTLFPHDVAKYHSQMLPEQRRRALRDFKDGMVRILATCKALDEGVNVPDASIGIVISSTMTNRQRIQRLGRVLRRSEGKTYAALYYLYINGNVDEARYLPDEDDPHPMVDMQYLAQEDAYDCEIYTLLARRVIHDARQKGIEESTIWEFRRRVEQGVVLPDWMNRPEVLAQELARVPMDDVSRRNSLIAMKRIAQERVRYERAGSTWDISGSDTEENADFPCVKEICREEPDEAYQEPKDQEKPSEDELREYIEWYTSGHDSP